MWSSPYMWPVTFCTSPEKGAAQSEDPSKSSVAEQLFFPGHRDGELSGDASSLCGVSWPCPSLVTNSVRGLVELYLTTVETVCPCI